MSSRQRARLAASLRANRAEADVKPQSESESSSDEASDATAPAQPAFMLLDSSDSCSDEEDTAVSRVVVQKAAVVEISAPVKGGGKKKKKKKAKKKDPSDEPVVDAVDAEISALLEEIGMASSAAAAATDSPSALSDILRVDPKSLDVDSLIRQRFAGAGADTGADRGAGRRGAGVRQGNAKQHVHRLGGAARFVFGMPKDEWLKPPSYAGGGVGMRAVRAPVDMCTGDVSLGARLRGRTFYQFVWADEYVRVNEQFSVIQRSGDANRLVVFLSQNYYHMEGLLQLAMVFARTGQMDRASDLVRRCLYCIHCAEAEGFRPCAASALLDPAVLENKIYFAAVFRHMQIVGMLGCPSVAANIAKLLLSLNPFGDTAHVLLCLDYYLISAGEYEDFDGIYRNAKQLKVGIDTAVTDGKAGGDAATVKESALLDISDLPNWRYSAALNEFFRLRKCGVYSKFEEESDGSHGEWADSLLREALLRYPFFLHYILPMNVLCPGGGSASSVVGTASSAVMPSQWQQLLSEPFFRPLPDGHEFLALGHLGELYRARSAVLWTNKKSGSGGSTGFVDVEKWVYDIAVDVVKENGAGVVRSRLADWATLSSRPEIKKYLSADIDDFMEEFPRLPPDANPLDPQFADPRALMPVARGADAARQPVVIAGARRPNHNRRVVNAAQGGFGEMEDEEAHIMRQLAQFEAQEEEMREQARRQDQEVDLLNQYGAQAENARWGTRADTLLRRISNLPKPLKDFLCNILEQRAQITAAAEEDPIVDVDAFIDEESLLAEIDLIRAADAEGETRAVNDAELQQIVSELLWRTPEEIFAEHSAASNAEEDTETLDLNQPLMQLFLRSFLPWNRLDPAAMRR